VFFCVVWDWQCSEWCCVP